jgi:urease accessory protein
MDESVMRSDRRRSGMTKQVSTLSLVLLMLALGGTAAEAHTGVGHASGFAHGFAHPLGGLDHVLAMLMVGVLAAQLGGMVVWALPASFVAAMALAGVAGFAGVTLPFFEIGIAASVVALGVLVACRLRAAVPLAMGLAAFFAIFHGYAHGAEIPENASGLAYGFGFVAATTLLHGAGVMIGVVAGERASARNALMMRSLGTVVACVGVGILVGVV